SVYLESKKIVGVVAAKVVKESEFDYKEWKIGLKLGSDGRNPFVLQYLSTTSNKEFAIIIMETYKI
ncbi:MAG: hypothetical protein EZS28_056685, partial [Streblomastix strix]